MQNPYEAAIQRFPYCFQKVKVSCATGKSTLGGNLRVRIGKRNTHCALRCGDAGFGVRNILDNVFTVTLKSSNKLHPTSSNREIRSISNHDTIP